MLMKSRAIIASSLIMGTFISFIHPSLASAVSHADWVACVATATAEVEVNPLLGSASISAKCGAEPPPDKPRQPEKPNGDGGDDKASAKGPSRAQIIAENKAREERNRAITQEYKKTMEGYASCVSERAGIGDVRSVCGDLPASPNLESMADVPGLPKPATPDLGLPPETIGYVASTQLQLPNTSIRIGPDPSWNEWNKAFVGHPYWLWVDSPTKPISSSQSVGPIKVGLTASLASITYRVKGEDAITCKGAGTPYVRSEGNVGKQSPDCGFRFTAKGKKTLSRRPPGTSSGRSTVSKEP